MVVQGGDGSGMASRIHDCIPFGSLKVENDCCYQLLTNLSYLLNENDWSRCGN